MNASHIAEVLRQARKSKGLTQEELAEQANVSPITIYRYEKAQRGSPQGPTLTSICNVLGIAPEALIKTNSPKTLEELKTTFHLFETGIQADPKLMKGALLFQLFYYESHIGIAENQEAYCWVLAKLKELFYETDPAIKLLYENKMKSLRTEDENGI